MALDASTPARRPFVAKRVPPDLDVSGVPRESSLGCGSGSGGAAHRTKIMGHIWDDHGLRGAYGDVWLHYLDIKAKKSVQVRTIKAPYVKVPPVGFEPTPPPPEGGALSPELRGRQR